MTSATTLYLTPPIIVTTTPTATIESVSTATIKSIYTVTSEYRTTLSATLGETITIYPPPSPYTLMPTSASSLPVTDSKITVTVTEVEIGIQVSSSVSYSTWTVQFPNTDPMAPPTGTPSPYTVIVGPNDHHRGWDSWSSAQKGGLIAGVVIAGMLMLAALLIWLFSRSQIWIAHDWSVNSDPAYAVNQPGQIVSYGYTGWGLRGGGDGSIRDQMGIRRWLRGKLYAQRSPGDREAGTEPQHDTRST